MVACIDAHRDRFGVEPICRVLRQEGYRIAPSTYYAAESRPPSARTVRDAWLEGEIVRVFKASGERSGPARCGGTCTASTFRWAGARWSG